MTTIISNLPKKQMPYLLQKQSFNYLRTAFSLYSTPSLPLSPSFLYEKSSEACIAERNI